MDLSLQFASNDTAHDDVVLRFGGGSWVCDSYYLALDGALMSDREDDAKVRAVLRRLLEQWLESVENLPNGGTAYFPYDFSDQFTGWLACGRSGDNVTVSRGWASVEGWSFFPSSVGNLLHNLTGFRVDGPTIHGSISDLITAIRGSWAALAEHADEPEPFMR